MGFTALGLEVCPVSDAAEAKQALRTLTRSRDDVAIIYIEEGLAAELSQEIDKFKDSPKLIPGREGSLGLGLTALNDAVERAIGTNILENN